MVVDGFTDWLLVEDPEVRKIARLEQAMYRHHFGESAGTIPWSIVQQAMQQDPGLYALAVATHPSGRATLVTHSLPTGATQYHAEVSLIGGDLRVAFARPEGGLQGPRVSTGWVALRGSRRSHADSELGSWESLALLSTRTAEFPAFVRLQAVSALGGACICARRLDEPEVQKEIEIILGEDRRRAARFVAEVRGKIIAEVKSAHQRSESLERYWYGEDSFYTRRHARVHAERQRASGEKRAGDGGDESGTGKRVRRE